MSRWFFKTQQDIADEQERKLQRQLDNEGKRMAKYYAKLIPQTLAHCGIDHRLPKADRPGCLQVLLLGQKSRQKVRIAKNDYTDHAIYLQVDPRYLPYNATTADLHSDEILETLTHACQRQVVWSNTAPENGCFYVIWREGAFNAIPRLFKFSEVLPMIPANASPLTYIAGVGENNRLEKVDIASLPHLLVAGSTGAGKSVHLNQMLCQLISRNDPDTLKMMMIDLKDGSEFAYYEDLPHLVEPIVKDPADVPNALTRFHAEMRRRRELFASRGIKTLEGWNHSYPGEKLPYVLLVFDELALVMTHTDRKIVKDAVAILNAIMSTARSSGGHVILCTQSPRTDIIPAWIKTNAPGRVCFAVPSYTDSIVVLDLGIASTINPEIHGRFILAAGARFIELQSPYISDAQITQMVREAIARANHEAPPVTGELTLQEVLDLAVSDYGGKLHVKKLYPAFKERASRDYIERLLSSLNGKPIIVNGQQYKYVKGGRGMHGGARLERIGISPEKPETTPGIETRIIRPKHMIPHELLKGRNQSRESIQTNGGGVP